MGFRMPGRRMWVALVAATPLVVLAIMASGDVPNLTASPVAAITDDVDGFTMLRGAKDITVAEIAGSTYALIVAGQDNGVQIVNITNPAAPVPVAELIVGIDGFGEMSVQRCEALPGCHMMTAGINGSGGLSRCSCDIYSVRSGSIAVAEISGGTYALLTTAARDGVQIVNITKPSHPVPIIWLTDDADGFMHLSLPRGIAIAEISDKTYALVYSGRGEGIQIIDITNPAAPAPVIGLTQGFDGFIELDEPPEAAITGTTNRTHALVHVTNRAEGIQIIDITNPAAPVIAMGLAEDAGGFAYPPRFRGITTAEISGGTYALIPTSGRDGGIQIINITNPAAPIQVAWVTDGIDGFTELDEPRAVAVAEVSGRTYALVLAFEYIVPWMPFGDMPPPEDLLPDHGVQIIDITNPAAPIPVAWLTDEVDGFTELYWVDSIAVAEVSGRTYALVTASLDDGVQIIELTHPQD